MCKTLEQWELDTEVCAFMHQVQMFCNSIIYVTDAETKKQIECDDVDARRALWLSERAGNIRRKINNRVSGTPATPAR
jgi:hypothetical protein